MFFIVFISNFFQRLFYVFIVFLFFLLLILIIIIVILKLGRVQTIYNFFKWKWQLLSLLLSFVNRHHQHQIFSNNQPSDDLISCFSFHSFIVCGRHISFFFQSFKNCVTFVISISFVKIVRSVKSFINSSFSSSIRKIVRSVNKYCVSSLFGDFKYFFRSFWKMWFLFLSYLSNYFLKVKAKCIIYYYVHG